MPDDLSSWIAKAREVIARATPGPLYAEPDPGTDCPECDAEQPAEHAVLRSKATTGGVAIVMDDDRAEENAALIVLAVNSLPALLDAVEALGEMVSTQEEWERAVAKVIKSEPGVFPRAIGRGRAALARLAEVMP